MDNETALSALIERAKARGAAPLLLGLLDALEPAAPVLASGLLVTQPLANLWRGGEAWRALADLLDAPEGVDALRRQLSDEGD